MRKTKKKIAKRKTSCAAKTRDGKKCKRMVTAPAKFCYLHKRR
ncbi:MAG: hypothetical protein NTV06_04430 [candidate division Zixibacteria bacterium]|nr:hypothetical protein [candidate division Zixibacteria bacterium]